MNRPILAEGVIYRGRVARRTDAPLISVVVASTRERAALEASLAPLRQRCAMVGAELVVVSACAPGDAALLTRALPGVRVVQAPCDCTLDQLRSVGMAEASGDIVTLVDDRGLAELHRVEFLLEHAQAERLSGEPDPAPGETWSRAQWQTYLAQHDVCGAGAAGALIPRAEGGAADAAPPLAEGHDQVVEEIAAWAWWRSGGEGAPAAPAGPWRLGAYCAERFQRGRTHARARLARTPGANRWLLLVASPVLPPLLTWRAVRAAEPAARWARVRVLPAAFACVTAWCLGELAGYLRGPDHNGSLRDGPSDDGAAGSVDHAR